MDRKSMKEKVLVILILFMLMFSSLGNTMLAIASSDGFQVISNGFFRKDEIEFKAYFENGKEEIIGNVNEKIKLILEVNPQVDGYLQEGLIRAVPKEGEKINFKISGIEQNIEEIKDIIDKEYELNALKDIVQLPEETVEQNNSQNENQENIEDNAQEIIENAPQEVISNEDTNTVDETEKEEPNSSITDMVESVDVVENLELVGTEQETKSMTDFIDTERPSEIDGALIMPENTESEDEMIDEEAIIEQEMKAKMLEERLASLISDVKLESENEVRLSNIKADTKIELEIEYVQEEELKLEDLLKTIKLQLSGTFINEDLEEVAIGKEEEIIVGWEYSKEIMLESEYTKFSPFEINGTTGTIVENKITITRNPEEEKYLPIRASKIEIEVPKVEGKSPIEVGVNATKLLATRGEDIGEVTFSQENWTYNEETGKIEIQVTNESNGIAANGKGTDEYIITYRYEKYVEAEKSNLGKVVKATVEEYSSKENKIQTKEINQKQDIKAELGEIVTYSISTTEEKINKAKVYANYNSEETVYEAEYKTQVSVNVLTSDVLERLVINSTEEVYKDINKVELPAEIANKEIRFNYSELKEMLSEGGEIVITSIDNEMLYIMNYELLEGEENCIASLNNAKGIVITVNNLGKNGTINFEITKAIGKCNYPKATLKSFVELESRIDGEVKYKEQEETVKLGRQIVTKELEESRTSANITLNKESLTTIQTNENVEIKIELNNDKENSDLYVNPSFEIVFPKYVREVNVESINLVYEEGLRVADFETYTESDIVKMRVDFEGTQRRFSESTITNGTNIIINATVKVDEYTPAKEDQIKLYYCNEGVSNYESQTKWTISKQIPNNILKSTNGFDVEIIKYQAPKGLVVANGIVNYDGKQSEVSSVKEGTETRQVGTNEESRIATMELLALNNTGNECTEIVFLGRVPFRGNKNVITGEDIGTTTDALMVDKIKEDVQNINLATIYYSSNPNATKDIKDKENGWTEEITDVKEVRSYLIEVKGTMAAGAVLRYAYDFEIPEKLPYDASIAGSFGAYFNNNTDVGIVYESSSADKVGLVTEAGPKLDAKMTVDIGDGAAIQSSRRIKYTVTVVNNGSVPAENITVNATIPQNATYAADTQNMNRGDFGFQEDNTIEEITENLGTLNPGEAKEYSYHVITGGKIALKDYASGQDEQGYYMNVITGYDEQEVTEEVKREEKIRDAETGEFILDENGEPLTKEVVETVTLKKQIPIYGKQYITEVPKSYITNKATVTSTTLANPIETNEVSNELKYANFSSDVTVSRNGDVLTGLETTFSAFVRNISREELRDVVFIFNVGKVYQYESVKIDDKAADVTYDESAGKIYINIGTMPIGDVLKIDLVVKGRATQNAKEESECYFEFTGKNIETEYSSRITQKLLNPVITAEDITLDLPEEIKEGEVVIISTKISNIGTTNTNEVRFETLIPEALELRSLVSNNETALLTNYKGQTVDVLLNNIKAGESMTLDMTLRAENLPGSEDSLIDIDRIIHCGSQADIKIEGINFKIVNSEKTDKEIEEEKLLEQIEEDRKNNENKNNNSNNNQQNQPTQDNTSNDNNTNNDTNNNVNQDSNNQNNNNTNNNANTNIDNNVNKDNSQTQNPSNADQVITNKYEINGKAWLDTNKNGGIDSDEQGLSGIKVYLMTTTNSMLKSTVTASDGTYKFMNLENGNYVIGYAYDEDLYQLTMFRKSGIAEEINSDAVDVAASETLTATTNTINVTGANVENINIGLQNKDVFDLVVNKYLSKITVETSKETKTYDYENEDIAKVEIKAKYINGAKVDLEYTIVVENVGNLEGYAEQVVDYLEEGLEFNENQNQDWYEGTDGYIYTKNLKETTLQPGQKKEIKLHLSKTMTEDNTGWVTNKIGLLNSFTQSNTNEKEDGNTGVQNTFITISTGKTTQIVVITSVLVIIGLIVYGKVTGKVTLNLSSIKNKVYKTNMKRNRNNNKRIYK